MPAPEREARPQFPRVTSMSPAPLPSPSSVSMSDLLASCAAASAVSTPPNEPSATEIAEGSGGTERPEGVADAEREVGRRDAA
ncbi:hypothetical protein ACIOJD_05300 [Streptomyces sp. NPDC088116]|uniref:hypothetical protein n=1 Tax=Streptomyces sp. NPDC088116 TaxID=3365825 RepID=UPI0038174C33